MGSATKYKFALLAAQQANESKTGGVEAKKRLYSGSWLTEDGRLAPQNNHFIGVWIPGSSIDQRWG